MRAAIILWMALALLFPHGHAQSSEMQPPAAADSGPALLSFDELTALSSTAQPAGSLAVRVNALLTTPFVQNNASGEQSPSGVQPAETSSPVLRMGQWNIERGLSFDLIRSALTDSRDFERLSGFPAGLDDARRARIEAQLSTLQHVDVLVLNEVDWGMKRTEYRNVAHDLAAAMHMNYAYGVEFVEVDPLFSLGIEPVQLPDPAETERLRQDLHVDPERYLGLHGTAILSRYPIENVRIVRLPVCYDWYGQETRAAARLEQGKRWAVHRLFDERIGREIRHGGRMALIADLAVPSLPEGKVTVVATHLENRCAPACRRRQMRALLQQIGSIRNPVVLAGDLNTTSRTNTPTSVRNEIMSRVTDYQFWIGQTISWFHPLGIYQHALAPVHYFHGYNDPTAFHFPVLWNNKERPLFGTLEKFRFADGRAFDFRGTPDRTVKGREGTLADSNARAAKGFVPTYAFARDYGGLAGRFKLDWILVKPYIDDPRRNDQSWFFAPRFPETMRELNESVPGRISDHAPLTVDLPLSDDSK